MDISFALSMFLALTPPTPQSPPFLSHFPSWPNVNQALVLNQNFREWCIAQGQLRPNELQYWVWMQETQDCKIPWAALHEVYDAWDGVLKYRVLGLFRLEIEAQERYLDALDDLEEILGREAFTLGYLGPCIPIGRFVRD